MSLKLLLIVIFIVFGEHTSHGRRILDYSKNFGDLNTSQVVHLFLKHYYYAAQWFSVCKESDRMLTKCVKNIFMMFQPQLDTGIRELDIPPAEPLVMPILMLKETTMTSDYMTTLMDLKAYGVTSYKIKDIRGDMEEGKVSLTLAMPQIKLSADYEAKGTYYGAPVRARGKFHANLTKCTVDIKIKGQEGSPSENEYFLMNDIRVAMSVGMAKGYFTNLSQRNNETDSRTNSFLAANSLEMLKEVRPALEMLIKMLIEDVGDKFAKFHSYNKMFSKT